MWETWVQSLGWEDPLEEGMATHSNILAWRIPIDRRVWWATVHGGHKELGMTEQLSARAHTHTHTSLGFNSVNLRHLQLGFWFDWLK